ncbi:hypothetical protein RRG08_015540 [Elysia crispata]|uniref:Uncharacterized protein n=1 Tax=Elysia crispata TaxID=231223 RepID=A0AAE0YKL4_9GAST|nr:hypothetical protein RRG08_015540 [Elysia crispata]
MTQNSSRADVKRSRRLESCEVRGSLEQDWGLDWGPAWCDSWFGRPALSKTSTLLSREPGKPAASPLTPGEGQRWRVPSRSEEISAPDWGWSLHQARPLQQIFRQKSILHLWTACSCNLWLGARDRQQRMMHGDYPLVVAAVAAAASSLTASDGAARHTQQQSYISATHRLEMIYAGTRLNSLV